MSLQDKQWKLLSVSGQKSTAGNRLKPAYAGNLGILAGLRWLKMVTFQLLLLFSGLAG